MSLTFHAFADYIHDNCRHYELQYKLYCLYQVRNLFVDSLIVNETWLIYILELCTV